MATILRSISQLSKIESTTNILSGSRLEISLQNIDGTFSSKAIEYGVLSSRMNNLISSSMADQYNLSDSYGDTNIQNVIKKVSDILSGDISLDGTKTFLQVPKLKDGVSYSSGTQYIASVGKVQQMISSEGTYIGQSSKYDYPFHSNTFPKSYTDDPSTRTFYRTKIANGETESGILTANQTGNLVMWGWLADRGSIDAEFCWVGLFGVMDTGDGITEEIPLQIQPWIVGQYSSSFQYVGFNVMVQSGMRLKIKTGFPVNATPQAGYQSIGSLTYRDNQPCSFFGYMIQNT